MQEILLNVLLNSIIAAVPAILEANQIAERKAGACLSKRRAAPRNKSRGYAELEMETLTGLYFCALICVCVLIFI
jgi:hypothetical protein